MDFGLVFFLSTEGGFRRFGNECVMEASKVNQLKLFIKQCDSNPAVLQDPALKFFRDYLEKLGAKLPDSAYGKGESAKKTEAKDSFVDESDDDMPELEEQFGPSSTAPKVPEETPSDEEIVESEVELDNEGVIEPDNDPPQKMGDPSIEVTEEKRDEAQMAKSKGMEAMADGDLDEAVNHLTEAIECNPTSAIIYATRASVFVKMKKPNAAIRDANAAI